MNRAATFVSLSMLFLLSGVYAAPSAAQQRTPPPQPSQPNGNIAGMRNFSVNGMVSDAASHSRLDLVKLELRSFSGPAVGTIFTSGNGNFQFDNVTPGTYTLIADLPGYQTASEQVEVNDSSIYGVQIELLRKPDASTTASKGSNTVSVRDLSIPPKAKDDVERGMALLYGKSDYAGSLKAFQAATREYPDYYEAYTQIGVAYVKLADTVKAEQAFRKSIEVSKERYPDAYIGLAELFLGERRFADAEPLARKAVELDSNSWQADSQLARVLIELHRPSEAETRALAAVKLRPDNATLYLVLANVHVQLQDNRALLDDLNHYLSLSPDGSFAEQARRERDEIQEALAAPASSPATSSRTQP